MLAVTATIGLTITAVTVGAALLYFAQITMPRPPGIFGLADVLAMIVAIVLIPYIYLLLPPWALDVLLVLGGAGLVALTVEPLTTRTWAVWLGACALAGLNVWLARRVSTLATPFLLLNNGLLIVGVVGAANLWAQAGLSARNLALLAGLLTIYDVCFTSLLPLMSDLMDRVAELPLGPVVRWPMGDDGMWMGIGLGDLIMATVAPLVFWKAYGRGAAAVAVLISLVTVAIAMALLLYLVWTRPLPLMAIFGPATIVHDAWWRLRRVPERTTRKFRRPSTASTAA